MSVSALRGGVLMVGGLTRIQVVYEVTLEVDEDIVDDYLDWIRSGHIQGELQVPPASALPLRCPAGLCDGLL